MSASVIVGLGIFILAGGMLLKLAAPEGSGTRRKVIAVTLLAAVQVGIRLMHAGIHG